MIKQGGSAGNKSSRPAGDRRGIEAGSEWCTGSSGRVSRGLMKQWWEVVCPDMLVQFWSAAGPVYDSVLALRTDLVTYCDRPIRTAETLC